MPRRRARIGGRELDWLVAETEDPYRSVPTGEGFDTFRRLRVMDRLNFRMLDFRYIQPALSEDQSPAENLLLIARPASGEADAIGADIVLNIVAEYMRWAMRIDDPAGNGEYRRMARSPAWRDSVELIGFGDYLGWTEEDRLRIVDIVDAHDPELTAAIEVYETVHPEPDTTWPADAFRVAVQWQPPPNHRSDRGTDDP